MHKGRTHLESLNLTGAGKNGLFFHVDVTLHTRRSFRLALKPKRSLMTIKFQIASV
jgi:hypothetical protein